MRKRVAIDLYDAAAEKSDDERNWMQEAVLRNFGSGNHTFKLTFRDRFAAFDHEVEQRLPQLLPRQETPLRVHDVGVSDGRTTCALFDLLQRTYDDGFELLASDYDIEVLSVPIGKGNSRVILDGNENPLQLILPPFVLNLVNPVTPYFYPVNWLARVLNTKSAVHQAIKKLRDQSSDIRKIHIVCTECQDLARNHENVKIMQYDLLSKPLANMHIVRAMNLLNKSYFAPPEMQLAIDNIRESLVDGGLLITGTNVEAGTQINGGIYRRNGDTFDTIFESGHGSPVSSTLTSTARAA